MFAGINQINQIYSVRREDLEEEALLTEEAVPAATGTATGTTATGTATGAAV